MVAKVHQVEWHRNGICGQGFWVVLFDGINHSVSGAFPDANLGLMVAIVHEQKNYCSVLRVADLSDPSKKASFGVNSWRGDYFEPELREAIKGWSDTGKMGAFSIPAMFRKRL